MLTVAAEDLDLVVDGLAEHVDGVDEGGGVGWQQGLLPEIDLLDAVVGRASFGEVVCHVVTQPLVLLGLLYQVLEELTLNRFS